MKLVEGRVRGTWKWRAWEISERKGKAVEEKQESPTNKRMNIKKAPQLTHPVSRCTNALSFTPPPLFFLVLVVADAAAAAATAAISSAPPPGRSTDF